MRIRGKKEWRWLAALSLLPGLSGLTGCRLETHLHEDGYSETFEKRFVATRVNTLQIHATGGEIHVQGTNDRLNEILVQATTRVEGAGSESERARIAAQVKTTARLNGSILIVETDYPQWNGLGKSVSVDYTVTLPKRMLLDLASQSGNIFVNDVMGGMSVETASGDIELHHVGGAFTVRTASGAVSMDAVRAANSLQVVSASGEIHIADCRALSPELAVEARSQSGEVAFSGAAGELTLQTASGDITAELTAKMPLTRAELHSASGSISLTLPRAANARITAHTASGNISLSDVGHPSDEAASTQTVTLGTGSAPVTLETASGDIELKTAP